MDQIATGAGTSTLTQTASPYVFSQWQPWYQGIDRAVGTADLAFDAVPPVARKQNVNALRVDLTNPNVSFYTTPKGGCYQTVGATITGFLNAATGVMVAINANFSWYDDDDIGGNFSLLGLAVSRGELVCDPALPAPQPTPTQQADVPDKTYAGAMAMLISAQNAVSFRLVTQADPPPGNGVYTAIAGGPQPAEGNWPPQKSVPGPLLLVENGFNNATPEQSPAEKVAGRTGVGLSADERYLYLVTLDGCENSGHYGGGFYDIAQWLIVAGAYTGLNLDGGGSTAMACRGSDNTAIPMNVPYGDEANALAQRAVGNFFGVVTLPLP